MRADRTLKQAGCLFVTALASIAMGQAQPGAAPSPAPAPPPAPAPTPAPTSAEPTSPLSKIRADATAMADFVASPMAKDFLRAAPLLPSIAPRTLLYDRPNRAAYTPDQAAALPEDQRAKLEKRELGEEFYYNTRYGSPLAYARPLDLLATLDHPPPLTTLDHKKVADFGYGNIGQLRLMAASGAQAVGIDVDKLLAIFYSEPLDLGPMPRLDASAGAHAAGGTVALATGRWPAEPEVVAQAGSGFDLFISKNTLKRGYIHPEREADPRTLINLGVTDEQFLAKLSEVLNPGGWAVIYNICPAPAPADKPYIPWADGRCPFTQDAIKAAGFEIVAYDHDDTDPARRMAHILGWDQGDGGMNLNDGLFAWYTILHKPEPAK